MIEHTTTSIRYEPYHLQTATLGCSSASLEHDSVEMNSLDGNHLATSRACCPLWLDSIGNTIGYAIRRDVSLYSELFTQALIGGKCMTTFTIARKFGIASVL